MHAAPELYFEVLMRDRSEELERARRIREVRRLQRVARAEHPYRRRIGLALVRAGERLAGTGTRPAVHLGGGR